MRPEGKPNSVGTGRVVLDNKGNPIKKYEPFFSATHEYEDEAILVEWGVTPIMRYDALGRLIRTEMPDGSVSRVEFTPWEQSTFDGNDTVLETDNAWYAARQSAATPTPSTQVQRAATLTADHADTPAVVLAVPILPQYSPKIVPVISAQRPRLPPSTSSNTSDISNEHLRLPPRTGWTTLR